MKLADLAEMMGKSIEALKEDLEKEDVIELKLTEKNTKQAKENGNIETV